jgi:hypothetical protein
LIKSVTCQVLAGQPSHVARQPPSLASTDFQLQIPCYRLLESVPVKPIHEREKNGADLPGSLVSCHPLGPLVSGLCTLPPRVRCILEVILILVEFQFSL